MNFLAQPANLNELISFIADFVKHRFISMGRNTDGSNLALAIRNKYPNINYSGLGIYGLVDAVDRAIQGGFVVRQPTQHLEVSPGPASGLFNTIQYNQSSILLRYEVWKAFVSGGKIFYYDKENSKIIKCLTQEQEDNFKNKFKYIKIDSIAPDLQSEWVNQFSKKYGILDKIRDYIDRENGWMTFPAIMQRMGIDLNYQWKKARKDYIIEYVRKWASQNNIPFAPLIETFEDKKKYIKNINKDVPVNSVSCENEPLKKKDEEILRKIVLSAIQNMSISELSNLQIPIRYIVPFLKNHDD